MLVRDSQHAPILTRSTNPDSPKVVCKVRTHVAMVRLTSGLVPQQARDV